MDRVKVKWIGVKWSWVGWSRMVEWGVLVKWSKIEEKWSGVDWFDSIALDWIWLDWRGMEWYPGHQKIFPRSQQTEVLCSLQRWTERWHLINFIGLRLNQWERAPLTVISWTGTWRHDTIAWHDTSAVVQNLVFLKMSLSLSLGCCTVYLTHMLFLMVDIPALYQRMLKNLKIFERISTFQSVEDDNLSVGRRTNGSKNSKRPSKKSQILTKNITKKESCLLKRRTTNGKNSHSKCCSSSSDIPASVALFSSAQI